MWGTWNRPFGTIPAEIADGFRPYSADGEKT